MRPLNLQTARSTALEQFKAPHAALTRVLDRRMCAQFATETGAKQAVDTIRRSGTEHPGDTLISQKRAATRLLLQRDDVLSDFSYILHTDPTQEWALALLGASAILGSEPATDYLRTLPAVLAPAAEHVIAHLPTLRSCAELTYSLGCAYALIDWLTEAQASMHVELTSPSVLLAHARHVEAFTDGIFPSLKLLQHLLPCPPRHHHDSMRVDILLHDIIYGGLATMRAASTAITFLDNKNHSYDHFFALLRQALVPSTQHRILYALKEELFPWMAQAERLGIDAQIVFKRRSYLRRDSTIMPPLRLVCRELMRNAIKYRDPSKDAMWIRWIWDDANETIVVRDNGLGIRDTEAVFTVGTRERPDVANGTGLGLYSARQRMRDVGGDVLVTSLLGVSTEFRIQLPTGHVSRGDT